MYRQKVLVIGAAVLAIGVAFAAESTSVHAERSTERVRQVAPWVPGTNMVMSAHDSSSSPLAPPR
jgi:hypothetical protein